MALKKKGGRRRYLYIHDGENGLVQYGVADVFAGLRVGCDLREDIVHCLGRLRVVLAEDAE